MGEGYVDDDGEKREVAGGGDKELMAVGNVDCGLVGSSNQLSKREVGGDRGSGGGENVPPEGSRSRREARKGSGGSGGRGGGGDDSMLSGEERVKEGDASGARGSGGER